jgi:hypothetical protein
MVLKHGCFKELTMKNMLKTLFVVLVGFVVTACGTPGSPANSGAQPNMVNPTFTAFPMFEQQPTGNTACVSDNSVTAFSSRPDLLINGTLTGTQVRDANCPRALFHDETGVAKGKNWDVNIPAKWAVAFAAVTCEVQENGYKPVQYLDTPFIVIRGPWVGSIGCYEAGVHGTVSEWEDFLTQVIKPIHDSEVGHTVPLTIITAGN